MIDTIIFDIGRVLVKFEWQEYLGSFSFPQEIYNALANAMFTSGTWNEFDRGALSDAEILELFIKDAPEYQAEIHRVFKNFPACLKTFPYACTWVQNLKERNYHLYYLSNYAKTTHIESKKALAPLDLMDGGVMSYEIKHIKPEPEIYLELFKRYDIIPEHAVFIDDNEANIIAGKELGLHTILFTDYENASKQLEDLLAITDLH